MLKLCRMHRTGDRSSPIATSIAFGFTTALVIGIGWSSRCGRACGAEPVQFNRDIRPLLSENCFFCHGPDKDHRQAELRLDIPPEAVADTNESEGVKNGHRLADELIARIDSEDPQLQMPPPETNKRLTDEQKARLRQWIAEGAQYEGHWAYQPIQRPAVPQVASLAGDRSPIDAFIRTAQSQRGLQPAATADRRTLIRRLTLDLHGLPPTPEAIEAFVNDPAVNAYEQLVDQLLASPRFAERMAIQWLDAVRYADTVGFHGDQSVSVWPYRDYVLDAYHANKPFDQFTREQLAGDLIPQSTIEQRVATALNRLNRMSTEGGAQDKEYRAKYAADRVRTVSMVWLGSTMGCCECHDHKYDPLSTKDFYSLSAFFADIDELGFYGGGFDQGDWGPEVSIPSAAQQQSLERLDRSIAAIDEKIAATTDEGLAPSRERWIDQLRKLDQSMQLDWHAPKPTMAASSQGARLTIRDDAMVVADGPNPDHDTYTITLIPGQGEWTALRLTNGVDESLPGNRVARGWKSFVISEVEVEVSQGNQAPRPRSISRIEVDRQSDRYPAGAAIDADTTTGWGVEHGHSAGHFAILHFQAPIQTTAQTQITVRIVQQSEHRQATLGQVKLSLSRVPHPSNDPQGLPSELLGALRAAATERSAEQSSLLLSAYREAAEALEPVRSRRQTLQTQRSLAQSQIPTVLVSKSVEPRMTRVLPRGNWMDESGEVVQPNTPQSLPSLGVEDRRATRLDLAQWLVRDDQPLTARVQVNRYWKMFFGVGLSKQLEDVGSQGNWPTHPELLDWLASEFMQPSFQARDAHRWDVKHIIRLIVRSKAYQQTSIVDPSDGAKDPDNQWITRQIPIRVDAEVIRDSALMTAGMLSDAFGGPSIRPLQPSGYWGALNFPKREYDASIGEAQYRRSVYIHWQRTFLHPALLTFDASTREECQVQRPQSNTPLQALVMLNDPIFVEAARGLAQWSVRDGGETVDDQIGWLFERAVGRTPSEREQRVLRSVYDAELETYRVDRGAAQELLAIGDLPLGRTMPVAQTAAMTIVARTVMNLHEFITRD
jgi:hypothetical protein